MKAFWNHLIVNAIPLGLFMCRFYDVHPIRRNYYMKNMYSFSISNRYSLLRSFWRWLLAAIFFSLLFLFFVHTFYFVNSKLISFAFRLYIIIYCNSTLNHSLSETISSLFTYSIKFQCKWLTLPLLIAARMVNSAFVWPTFICLLEHGVAIFCYILFVKWLWNGFRWITTTATKEEKKNNV